MAKDDTYVLSNIMEFPNMTVRVFKPILTEEERERRMKRIEEAAIRFMLSLEKNKE